MSSVSKRHPVGLFLLCVVEFFERFAGVLVGSLLVFYLNERLEFDEARAARISGYVTALGYAAAVVGGIVADRVLGQRWALTLGLAAIVASFGLMACDRAALMSVSLALLTVGHGLFKPSITALVGMLYPAGDVRRSTAYGWLYFAVNLGGALGPLSGSAIRSAYGWPALFMLAAGVVICGLVVFVVARTETIPFVEVSSPAAAINLDRSTKFRIGALVLVLLVVCALGLAFAQTSGTLLIWARDNCRRELWGRTLPPDVFAALPSAIVLTLTPALSVMWRILRLRKCEPTEPRKLAIGLALAAVAFTVMATGAIVSGSDRASPLWLVGCKLLLTLGEMVALPVGLALASALAPPYRTGSTMGLSFGSLAVGYWLGGEVGRLWGLLAPAYFFGVLALAMLVTAVGASAFGQRDRS